MCLKSYRAGGINPGVCVSEGVLDVMEDANIQMAAMQAQFEETIAKLHEDFTARLRVLEASTKSTWYS